MGATRDNINNDAIVLGRNGLAIAHKNTQTYSSIKRRNHNGSIHTQNSSSEKAKSRQVFIAYAIRQLLYKIKPKSK